MSILEIHLFFIGIPLLLVIVLSALIWSRQGPHPATYELSEKWTHPPILWPRPTKTSAARTADMDVGIHGRRWRQWHVVK